MTGEDHPRPDHMGEFDEKFFDYTYCRQFDVHRQHGRSPANDDADHDEADDDTANRTEANTGAKACSDFTRAASYCLNDNETESRRLAGSFFG